MRTAARTTAVTACLLAFVTVFYASSTGDDTLLCLLAPLAGIGVLAVAAARQAAQPGDDIRFAVRENRLFQEIEATRGRGEDLFHHTRASLSLYQFVEYPDPIQRRQLSLAQLRRCEQLFERLMRRAELTGQPHTAAGLLTLVTEAARTGRLWLLADWEDPQLERALGDYVRRGELRRADGTEVSFRA
ncbi:hypothetical protein Lfu02_14480 [Longispora fulva]|uniref:Uncharacterized protein n=1 Tax=Longispora fulva TaxID=619741 RepID=A0A8J7KNR3_9ACTN|nr:hypothetical protein [Longispora fulva]MBG6140541.1 hypothetical protein [Longispora fulva]GIG57076.1 hypothetical protein Lfu02_14480 [Longispora fulva]